MNEADFRSAQVVISSFATAAQLKIPIVIAVVGYFVHRSVARLEDSLEQKRELIRRRIELYGKLGPLERNLLRHLSRGGVAGNPTPKAHNNQERN